MTEKYFIETKRGVWLTDPDLNECDVILDAYLFTKSEMIDAIKEKSVYRVVQFSLEAEEVFDILASDLEMLDDDIWGEGIRIEYLLNLRAFVEDECNDIIDEDIMKNSTFDCAITECDNRVLKRYHEMYPNGFLIVK